MAAQLKASQKAALIVQRWVSYLNFPWFGPLFLVLLYGVGGYRCEQKRALRKKVQELLAQGQGQPMILCANHLTMIDSMLISAFLFPVRRFMFDYSKFPWNIPEIVNFGKNFLLKAMCYLGKCVFIARQGSLSSKKLTWEKVKFLVEHRQLVCIFPEGGRSRAGRVEPENAVYGVGHLVQDLPGCKVLCVYLRGRDQRSYSFFPKRGDLFFADVALIEPQSPNHGRRGARDITLNVMDQLVTLEQGYLQWAAELPPSKQASPSPQVEPGA